MDEQSPLDGGAISTESREVRKATRELKKISKSQFEGLKMEILTSHSFTRELRVADKSTFIRELKDIYKSKYKGALSFTQLRTTDGTTYDTFKEACGAHGLLNNDKQWHKALKENAFSTMPTQIRAMFFNILVYCSVSDPITLLEKH
ncbi:hypothetical protein AgCh_031163 [Apium graveolens]